MKCGFVRSCITIAPHNPKYIQELYTALRETGIVAKETKQRTVKLKDSFKATHLYKAGAYIPEWSQQV
jgi:hypothetical protein